MSLFDTQKIAVEWLGYPISYVELIGTVFGFISVYLASRGNIFTWSAGIVNEFFLFLLFYQIQLYPDMLLQVFFFVMTLYGWYHWGKKSNTPTITCLSVKGRIIAGIVVLLGTVLSGFVFQSIHLLLPALFHKPAAYPFADSFVLVASIVATFLLIGKKMDNWFLWIAIDIVCVVIYLKKEIYFLSLEYLIFLGLATYGAIHWSNRMKHG